MKIAVIGNFFILWHKYALERLGIEYDLYDNFTHVELETINAKEYDFVLITLMWGKVEASYERIKHKTVFWSSEDPNHIKLFIQNARQCDYVFTTASECVPLYQEDAKRVANSRLKPENVDVLQFAMEPSLHTAPSVDVEVDIDVVFIGNRYGDCSVRVDAERVLLDPIINTNKEKGFSVFRRDSELNLKVYSPYWEQPPHGWAGTIPRKYYAGVGVYVTAVAEIYHRSHICLSMNEQIESPTMSSMRVFDIIGCGGLMLSYTSLATKNLFGDYVLFAETQEETLARIDEYMFNPKQFREMAMAGREYALANHTYDHRFRRMLNVIM